MEKLIRGLHTFQNEFFDSQQALFARLAKGQSPETLFITCSDSRINPNLLTQTEPGELFILRNAGNLVPPYGATNGGEGATIEYAVAALGVKDIIVCGHSHCGAMKGLLHPEDLDTLPAVAAWLKQAEATRRIIGENYADTPEEEKLTATVKENVLVQLENLRTHPSVASALQRGDLHLHGWVYEIESGRVYGYDPANGQFQPVTTQQAPVGMTGRPAMARGI
jgi:carbonic anhydrase